MIENVFDINISLDKTNSMLFVTMLKCFLLLFILFLFRNFFTGYCIVVFVFIIHNTHQFVVQF